jgi:predicted peptidase
MGITLSNVNTMKRLLIVIVTILATLSANSQYTRHVLTSGTGYANNSGQSCDNVDVAFARWLPAGADLSGATKYPVVIFLHGIGERGGKGDISDAGIGRIDNTYPFAGLQTATGATGSLNRKFLPANSTNPADSTYVMWLAPMCWTSYNTWPMMYPIEMIKYAQSLPYVDKNRIYITGLSFGGGGTMQSAQDIFVVRNVAAFVAFCAGYHHTTYNYARTASSQVPIWIIHSQADRVTQTIGNNGAVVSDSLVSRIIANKPMLFPKYFKLLDAPISDDHRIWDYGYAPANWATNLTLVNGSVINFNSPNIISWMLQYSLPATGAGQTFRP